MQDEQAYYAAVFKQVDKDSDGVIPSGEVSDTPLPSFCWVAARSSIPNLSLQQFTLFHSLSTLFSLLLSSTPSLPHLNPSQSTAMWCDVWVWASALQPHTHTLTHSHTHTYSLSFVPVVMMKSKELKTKISHAHSLILPPPSGFVVSSGRG